MSKRIYIGLSSPKKSNLFSSMIKLVLGTDYSHTYIRWETSWGFDAVYEASGASVKFVGGDIWHAKNNIHREWFLDLSVEEYHGKLLPYMMSKSGLSYAFLQVVIMGWRLLTGARFRVPKSQDKMVCSEIVYYLITEVFCMDWETNPDTVTPLDIERYLDGIT